MGKRSSKGVGDGDRSGKKRDGTPRWRIQRAEVAKGRRKQVKGWQRQRLYLQRLRAQGAWPACTGPARYETADPEDSFIYCQGERPGLCSRCPLQAARRGESGHRLSSSTD